MGTAVELSQLRRTWSAEFIPLPADLHVPRGGALKSALLNSTAVGRMGARRAMSARSWLQIKFARTRLSALLVPRYLNPTRERPAAIGDLLRHKLYRRPLRHF